MGDLVQNILCAELMGRYSNLVLVQNGKIIDASSGWILRTAMSGSCCRACPIPFRPNRPALTFCR